MRATLKAITLALAVAVPVVSYSQPSNQPLTRAQVRAQLREIERAGYDPARAKDPSYPSDIQAAEARLAAQHAATTPATGFGGTRGTDAASGHPVNARERTSMFGHH